MKEETLHEGRDSPEMPTLLHRHTPGFTDQPMHLSHPQEAHRSRSLRSLPSACSQPPHQFSSASSTIMRAAQRRCLPLGRVVTRPAAAAALLPAAAAPPLSCAARGLASSSSARLEDLRKQLEEEDAAGIAMSLIPPTMPVAEAASADAATPAPRRKKRLEPKPSM